MRIEPVKYRMFQSPGMPSCNPGRRKLMVSLLFILTVSILSAQDYNFRNFNTEDGLCQSYVYSIIQDKGGYLWIGTGKGLSRYNGLAFENFPVTDSLGESFITCSIGEGRNIWFGTYNRGLLVWDGTKLKPVNSGSPESYPVTCLARGTDGSVWAGVYPASLFRLDSDSGIAGKYVFNSQRVITYIYFLDKNLLLTGTDAGLFLSGLTDNERLDIGRRIDQIPASKITCIQRTNDNQAILIATENDGLYRLTYLSGSFRSQKITTANNDNFSGLQSVYEDSRGFIWLCTFGRGLISIKYSDPDSPAQSLYLNRTTGFPSNDVRTIFEDREGNLWSGNYGQGLTMITPRVFSVISYNSPSFRNNILSVCFDSMYRWLGTDEGLVQTDINTGKVIRFYGRGSGLPADKVTAIYSGKGHRLWIGTGRNGVFIMETDSRTITKYPPANGTLENSITSITGNGDRIWIGTGKGLLSVGSSDGYEKWYSISKGGLPHNYINALFSDREGRIWVTTPGNILSYIKDEKVFKITVNSPGGNLILGPVAEDSDFRIWAGSNGSGVFMIGEDSIVNLTDKDGLLSNYCYSLISDGKQNILVGHKNGLSRIHTSSFWVKTTRHFDSLPANILINQNSAASDPRGRIWFGTGRGLLCYDPGAEPQNYLPPVLGITSVTVNGEETGNTGRIMLPPGSYKIAISYLGVSLREPDQVSYQYLLRGYDQFYEITKARSVTYNHLTEGDYTFILKAYSGDGAITAGQTAVLIHIGKPVWKNWWFYIFLAAALSAIVYFYIMMRERRFIRERKILEERVRERTSEIETQKNEIEFQKDLIDAQNSRLTASITYASRIQKAIMPADSLISRLLPECFILNIPKDIVSGDFFWLTEKDDKVIFTVADCTGHGVPGAFMSLLAITFLNEIVNHQAVTRSDVIVNVLRERVIDALQSRNDNFISDGLDLTLCVLDRKKKIIEYSGGMSDFVFIHNGDLKIVKTDRISVCSYNGYPGPFTMNEIGYERGDVIYLYSDGYQDQFGGEFDKKFLPLHFQVTLREIHRLPMHKQKELLEKRLEDWRKGNVQTDDITVLGIRL